MAAHQRLPHLSYEARQQRIAGDVEGHPQAQVARALVHLARQLTICNVELQAAGPENMRHHNHSPVDIITRPQGQKHNSTQH